MKMDLVLELMDVPGQLVSVLDPISGLGANLVTVIHKRDSKNEVVKKEVVSTILIGHIVDNDIRDTMDKINSLDGVYVVGFDIKLDGESKSSALINIETDFGMKEFIFDKIGKIAAEKDLLMINEV